MNKKIRQPLASGFNEGIAVDNRYRYNLTRKLPECLVQINQLMYKE